MGIRRTATRLFLAGAAEPSGAAASALAAAFFFDFDFGVFVESALASVLLCEASVAAFFLLFFLVAVLLLSLWSVTVALVRRTRLLRSTRRHTAANQQHRSKQRQNHSLARSHRAPSLRFGLPTGRAHS